MLFTYAMALLGSETAAEEAVQESFRIACMKPEALIGSDNPRGMAHQSDEIHREKHEAYECAPQGGHGL